MTEEKDMINTEEEQLEGQLSLLDNLPQEEAEPVEEIEETAEETIEPVAETSPASPEEARPEEVRELTKKELRKQKKAEKKAKRKARRDNRVGVPVWVVILIIIGINGYWYYTVEYKYEPRVKETYAKYQANIDEYKRQIKVQDIIWRNREEYWQKEVDRINEKADQLQDNYELIMTHLGFEIDENGNAYKPGEEQ